MDAGTVAQVEAWAIFVLCWVFVAEHTILSWVERRRWGSVPWWRTVLGWLLTLAVGSLGTVVGFGVAASLWPVLVTYPWYVWSDLIAVGAVAAVVAGKVVARAWLHVRARRSSG